MDLASSAMELAVPSVSHEWWYKPELMGCRMVMSTNSVGAPAPAATNVHDGFFLERWIGARFDPGPCSNIHFAASAVVGFVQDAAQSKGNSIVHDHAAATCGTVDGMVSHGVKGLVTQPSIRVATLTGNGALAEWEA